MWDPPQNNDDTPWSTSTPSSPSSERQPFSMAPAPNPAPAATPGPPPPKPFSSIGSTPTPIAPDRTLLGSSQSVAPATPPNDVASSTPRRRRWPIALLALLTIVASGALSWGVATWVGESNNSDQVSVAATEPTAVPAVEDTATPTEPAPTRQSTSAQALEDEPFAQAAEIIRPSVVQLNLGTGLGTGVIINENGTILTAAHVVGDNDDVQVTFADGSSAPGEVVGTHTPTDVAVVKVDPSGRNLRAAVLADGDNVRVGQLAVAVGSPFGFDQTVTAGIISAVDRIVNGVSMVQTDAPINPGNSGGPLINLQGEVVGINDLIFTESGTSAGVGFAISIDLAVIIADQLIAGVEPQLALLGVETGPAPNGARGAQVGRVVDGSAANDAGLQVGDIVIRLNGVDTRGSADLRAQVIDQPPGSTITLTVLRNGERVDLEATLGTTGG